MFLSTYLTTLLLNSKTRTKRVKRVHAISLCCTALWAQNGRVNHSEPVVRTKSQYCVYIKSICSI